MSADHTLSTGRSIATGVPAQHASRAIEFGATSAVPYLAVAAACVLAVSCWQIRALIRSVGTLTFALPRGVALETHRCGLRLRSRSVLSVSYPMATLAIGSTVIAVECPLGGYDFDRNAGPSIVRRSPTPFSRLGRIEITLGEMHATVYVRNMSDVEESLRTMGWHVSDASIGVPR